MTDNAEFYKTTVFLPKTDFPMRGELPSREPQILAQWQKMDIYRRLRNQTAGRTQYILHDGPPYANGHIHVGHAMNKILKDVVVRTRQMMGYDTPYVPGWDCHGLPIEWKVEERYRNEGLNKDEVNTLKFREECRAFAQKWVDVQSDDFQRLGVVGDWENPYLTMTKKAEARIVREIHNFVRNGGLYKGLRPVMWSVVEKTALAEAEVEYREHKSITIWVRFAIKQSPVEALKGADIVIWTTTPWTIPSNRGLACGADVDYGLYQIDEVAEGARINVGEKLLLSDKLAASVFETAKVTGFTKLHAFKGADLKGTICAHPLAGQGYEFDVPLLEGEFVTDDAGTGFVHMAPSHGEDDFRLGKANGLEITDNLTDDGLYRDHVPLFAGLAVYTQTGETGEGNFAVLKALDGANRLLAKGSIRHEYPHSWRSKAPLIFRTTPQWFISMDTNDLRKTALKAIKDTKWVPAQGENRITAMVSGRPDWCISRQRSWGVPIALFLSKKTGEVLTDDAVLNRIGDIFEQDGSDAWFARPMTDFLGNNYNAEDYTQVFDVVDVWFESGSTHAFVLEDRDDLRAPADIYLEGSDQHRGWFQSSLLESAGTRGCAPYKTVLTHGFVLDDKGYKMSKSLGNVVDPLELLETHGADIVRLWVMTANYSDDIRIGKDMLKNTSDLYRRIRNSFRFILGALDGFDMSEKLADSEYKQMPELEQWVLHRLYEMDAELRTAIEAHDYNRVIQKLYQFCAQDLSALYFDIRKDRLYCDRPDLFERRATRTVIYHLFEYLTAWFAPFLSFTLEDVWSYRPAGLWPDIDSVHLREFPQAEKSWHQPQLSQKWERVFDVRTAVLGALELKRADKTIGSPLEAAPLIHVDEATAKLLADVDMAEVCITSQATVTTVAAPDEAFKTADVKNVAVTFALAEGKKCQRSWKILPEVGSDPEYPDLSPRDADAVRWFQKHAKAA